MGHKQELAEELAEMSDTEEGSIKHMALQMLEAADEI